MLPYFFVLFVLRLMLRRQWAAMIAFTVFFTGLQALGYDRVWLGALVGLLYFGTAAVVIVWFGGLLAFVVGAFVGALLFDVLATLDASAWFFGNSMLLVAIVAGLIAWSFYTSLGGRIAGRASIAR